MNDNNAVNINNGPRLSYKTKERPTHATTWVNLEGTMRNEISRSLEDTYHMSLPT